MAGVASVSLYLMLFYHYSIVIAYTKNCKGTKVRSIFLQIYSTLTLYMYIEYNGSDNYIHAHRLLKNHYDLPIDHICKKKNDTEYRYTNVVKLPSV